MRKERIPDLISEIKAELKLLDNLVSEIEDVSREKAKSYKKEKIYKESLALKLHNFYTGCERIFHKIADDINGGVPSSRDWHKRLLKSMSLDIEGIRPPVISESTAEILENYLAFRHVVRNIYGFEIESEKLTILIKKIFSLHKKFKKEINKFIAFLKEMSR